MEDKPLTESINKQYSKYGSLRVKEKESKIELCNAEDPMKFLRRIDSSIKDAKAKVRQTIDKSTISEDYESSYDQQPNYDSSLGSIPLVKIERNRSSNDSSQVSNASPSTDMSPSSTSNCTD